jgi:hypothetical protein
MTWYADAPGLRARQQVLDAAVLAWVLLAAWLGRAVHRAVSSLAAPGRELEEAGDGLTTGLSGAADRLGGVPGVGGGLRAPLDAAAGAGEVLARAGTAQQDAVGTLALVLGLAVAGLPIAAALAGWLPGRLRWSREATAARALAGDVELLALRAAASAPLRDLTRLGPAPVTRWRAGDEAAGRALADLELRRLGLRAEPRPA